MFESVIYIYKYLIYILIIFIFNSLKKSILSYLFKFINNIKAGLKLRIELKLSK